MALHIRMAALLLI
jgi:hypothetical protein